MSVKTVMTTADISRSLARIAHEIIERNKISENLAMVGIRTRGVPLAERLARAVGYLGGTEIPIGHLDIHAYRDDISETLRNPEVQKTNIRFPVDGKEIILVDDVLYTGRSIRAAMDAIIDLGRPRSIQLAVLVDRGHRELPIRADYIGKNIPSARYEDIQVRLLEIDGIDEVLIMRMDRIGDMQALTGGTDRKERR